MRMDPSILLQAKGIQLPDPAQMAMQSLTLGDLANRKRMHEYEMAAKARADAAAQAYEAALPGAVRGGFSDESIAGVDPRALPALLKQQEAYRKQQADLGKTRAETDAKQVEALKKRVEMISGNAFELAQNPNITIDDVGAFVQQARAMGLPTEVLGGMPQDPSPQGLQRYMKAIADKGVGALDKLNLAGQAATREETGRHNRATEGLTAAGQARMAADAAAGRQTQMTVAQMNDRRQRELTEATRAAGAGGKPPPGYRWNADGSSLEPIPGGPADKSAADAKRGELASGKADVVIQKVDEALGQVGALSTGAIGSVLGRVPGTGAYDLQRTADTIKANLGFGELQAMRDASPTGGALGAIAVQELQMLQSTLASLDTAQSEAQLRKALEQVKKHAEGWKRAVQQSRSSGGASGGWDAPPPPKPGDIQKGHLFKGGDPANPANWEKVPG